MALHENTREDLLRYYGRLSQITPDDGSGAVETMPMDGGAFSGDSIRDRTTMARDTLRKIVKEYLHDDPALHQIAEKIVQEGGESLRQLAGGDVDSIAEREFGFDGLEAIVRVDGSRPSFFVRDGKVDRDSSPLGDWGNALDDNDEVIRRTVASVGRIDTPGTSVGFQGTGFLINDNVIVTNRHVLQVSAQQHNRGEWKFFNGAAIDFGHEYDSRLSLNRRLLKRVLFCGSQPIQFNSIDHRKLDLALIELEPATHRDEPQEPLRLAGVDDALQPDTRICTIGYPGSPPPFVYQPTLLEQLFRSTYGHKRLAPGEIIAAQSTVHAWTLAHDATTLGGNSGSVVLLLSSTGSAAGLHYGGRGTDPRENWGHVLTRVLDETDGRSAKTLRQWLVELGASPTDSNGVAHRTTAPVTKSSNPPRASSSSRSTVVGVPATSSQAAAGDPRATRTTSSGNLAARPASRQSSRNWRQGVTLEMMQPLATEAAELEARGDGETAADELSDRDGYDPDFIPEWEIPLPLPRGDDLRTLRRGGDGVELKYEHFSVIMSKSRRMPIITACNINGGKSRRVPRIQQWSFDGRLDRDDQWGNDLYLNNNVDRGHMVRREDPVWGSLATARRANIDTFHYTNSCPQMAGVNQRIWLGLENYILSHTRDDEMLISVFTGPYFTDDDFEYRGALIPKAFWKVVAFVTEEGRPSATAYKISQARELQDLEFVFAGYKTFQISVQQVADATGIDFSELIPFDGFSQHERVHNALISEQLESFEKIRV